MSELRCGSLIVGALVLLLVFVAARATAGSGHGDQMTTFDDCCLAKKHGVWSFKSGKDHLVHSHTKQPLCEINRYLCRKSPSFQPEEILSKFLKLYQRIASKDRIAPSGVVEAVQVIGTLYSNLDKPKELCRANSLSLRMNRLPELFRRENLDTDNEFHMMKLNRIGKILALIDEKLSSECPKTAIERYKEVIESLDANVRSTVVKCLMGGIKELLGIQSSVFTEYHLLRAFMIHFKSDSFGKSTLDGLKEVGDEATVEFLENSGPNKPIAYRDVQKIVDRHLTSACEEFVERFRPLYPSLHRRQFQQFKHFLVPELPKEAAEEASILSDFYRDWLLTDACIRLKVETRPGYNPIARAAMTILKRRSDEVPRLR